MSDIELVIKISEKDYTNIKNAISSLIKNGVEHASMSKVCLAILDGTPLPKGHGRLKDADAICKNIISALGIRDENYLLEAEKAVYKIIKNALTIIEADRSEE